MDNIKEIIREKNISIKDNEKQHNYDVRERIEMLLDKESFIELGMHFENCCVVSGYGTIDGKLVYVYGHDYKIEGALMNPNSANKIIDTIEMALKIGAPLIQIIDSAGIQIDEGFRMLKKYSKINSLLSKASGVIPQVSFIAGQCVGMMSVMASMSDFIIISKNRGEMTLSSYGEIMREKEEYVDKNYFNSDITASITLENEEECIKTIQKIIRYIPSNNKCRNLKLEDSNKSFLQEELRDISKKDKLNAEDIVNKIIDDNTKIDLYLNISNNVTTILGKINGLTVGILTLSDEFLNIKDINKLTRFIKLCDAYHIPIISLIDTDGFQKSLDSENEGIYFSIAKLNYAIEEATIPKIALVIGKCFGIIYLILAGRKYGFDIVYAWPTAKICLSDPEHIIKNIKRQDIIQSDKPKEKQKELIDALSLEMISPYKSAEQELIDDIIEPQETRARLYMTLDMLQTKKELRHKKNHGSILI